jgi:hypothetical protein
VIETILIILACIVIGIPIFINTVGPFIIWMTQRIPTNVKFLPIDNDDFLKERNSAFLEYDKSLQGTGFEVVGSSLLQERNVDSHFRLYWSPEAQVSAMAVTMKSKVEEITYIEFSQKFSDGSVLDVSNLPRPEAYPTLDFKHAYRYPEKLDARDLLAAHTKLRGKIKNGVSAINYDLSRGFGEVGDFLKKESDALLQKGIVQPDIDEDGKRRLTLFGAFSLTYRSVPPGRYIWGYITEQRAKKALTSV